MTARETPTEAAIVRVRFAFGILRRFYTGPCETIAPAEVMGAADELGKVIGWLESLARVEALPAPPPEPVLLTAAVAHVLDDAASFLERSLRAGTLEPVPALAAARSLRSTSAALTNSTLEAEPALDEPEPAWLREVYLTGSSHDDLARIAAAMAAEEAAEVAADRAGYARVAEVEPGTVDICGSLHPTIAGTPCVHWPGHAPPHRNGPVTWATSVAPRITRDPDDHLRPSDTHGLLFIPPELHREPGDTDPEFLADLEAHLLRPLEPKTGTGLAGPDHADDHARLERRVDALANLIDAANIAAERIDTLERTIDTLERDILRDMDRRVGPAANGVPSLNDRLDATLNASAGIFERLARLERRTTPAEDYAGHDRRLAAVEQAVGDLTDTTGRRLATLEAQAGRPPHAPVILDTFERRLVALEKAMDDTAGVVARDPALEVAQQARTLARDLAGKVGRLECITGGQADAIGELRRRRWWHR